MFHRAPSATVIQRGGGGNRRRRSRRRRRRRRSRGDGGHTSRGKATWEVVVENRKCEHSKN
jgi:hypothetical protein